MSRRTVCLHIGYPKTATTFLQQEVLPRLESWRYLGNHVESSPLLNSLVKMTSFMPKASFEGRIPLWKEQLEEEEARRFGNVQHTVPLLISEETLLFRTLLPYEISWYNEQYSACMERLFERVEALFIELGLELKIIVTLRHQPQLIHSLYAEKFYYYSRFAEWNTFEKYLDRSFSGLHYVDAGLNNLEYHKTITLLRQRIGLDKVLALKYEDLEENTSRFFGELSEFLACDVDQVVQDKHHNVRAVSSEIKKANYKANTTNDPAIRMLSKIKGAVFGAKSPRPVRYMAQKMEQLRSQKPVTVTMTREQQDFIEERYRVSNQWLAELDPKFQSYSTQQ